MRMWRTPRLPAAMLVSAGIAGCSVATSLPVFEPGHGFHGCSSRLGSYALPRQVLNVQIHSSSDDFVLSKLDTTAVPDNAHHYCLEHDNNPFAEDSIRVYKDKIELKNKEREAEGFEAKRGSHETRTPFLQLVASKAVDHTAGVIRNLIRALFIGLSNNPDFPVRAAIRTQGTQTVVADHQVDPFNYYEMAELNQSIRRFGFCVVLSGYTFDERATSAAAYCNAPKKKSERHAPASHQAIRSMRWLVPKPTAGIFYRPRAPYTVEVYVNHRPDDKGTEWQLALTKNLLMENIMPIVSVGISRDLFATRRTGLIFDDGELADVCISKGNSITGATNIVLDVVYGVINLPAATIQGVISDTNTQQQLTKKRIDLIKAQEAYIRYLETGKEEDKAKNLGNGKGVALDLSTTAKNADGTSVRPTFASVSDTPGDAVDILNTEAKNPLKDICKKLEAAGTPGVSGLASSTGNY